MEGFKTDFINETEVFNGCFEDDCDDRMCTYSSISTSNNLAVTLIKSGAFDKWVNDNVDVLPTSFGEFIDLVDAFLAAKR